MKVLISFQNLIRLSFKKSTSIDIHFLFSEMLLAQNQKGLAAEAMRELGNLHYHTGNMRGAYRWWSEALDTLLGCGDAVRTWRSMVRPGQEFSQLLLDKCGLWGCLLGGTLCSNIAQLVILNLSFYGSLVG